MKLRLHFVSARFHMMFPPWNPITWGRISFLQKNPSGAPPGWFQPFLSGVMPLFYKTLNNTAFFPMRLEFQTLRLAKAVERHITEYGVTDFYVGRYGTFDSMAARAVKEAKKKYPYIQLILPYHPAERPIETPEGFDDTYYPLTNQHIPKRLAILKTNQIIMEHNHTLAKNTVYT